MLTRTTSKPITQRVEARLGWVWSMDDERGLVYAGSCPQALFAGSTIPKRQRPSQALRNHEEGSG